MIIAIDGPAASGKSTTAKLVAKALHLLYLDTGAMYRALAYALVGRGVDLTSEADIGPHLDDVDVQIDFEAGEMVVRVDGRVVRDEIRTAEMGVAASQVSAHPAVRYKMVALQQVTGKRLSAHGGGVVVDGRDIGTVVFPDAPVKIYMVASLEERARRRALELEAKGQTAHLERLVAEIATRDAADAARSVGPLKPAVDALHLDTTTCTLEEQVEFVLQAVSRVTS